MKGGRSFGERIGASSLRRLMLYVFLFALSERLVVALVFFLRWGFHATSGIELWFYYGVAGGTFDLYSAWDPAWWLLRGLGACTGGEPLVYSVHAAAALVSSLNAALFCLFVSLLHDRKTGFLAGILYGSIVSSLWNSTATVTHDVFAYPFIILSLLGALLFFRGRGPVRLLSAGLCLLSLFVGAHIGPGILVAAGALLIYILWECVRAVEGERVRGGGAACLLFLAVVVAAAFLLHFTAMPALMERLFDLAEETRGIDVRAQIRIGGAGDLLASSTGDYWLRLNYLLFFLPAGLFVAFRKRDMLGWGLVVAGLLASCAADRGIRPLSFGAALAGALALTNWRGIYGWTLAAAVGCIVGFLGGTYYLIYAVFFPSTALILYFCIRPPGGGKSRIYTLYFPLLWLAAACFFGGIAAGAWTARVAGLVRNVWTIQLCVLVPLALLLAEAWACRPSDAIARHPINISLDRVVYGGLLATGVLFLVFNPAAVWRYLYLIVSPVAAAACFVLQRTRRGTGGPMSLAGVAAVCWLFAVVIASVNLTPRSTEAEYRLYGWLGENGPRGGTVFTSWSDGYFVEAVSGHTAEISPERLDFELPRVYWMTEEEASRTLREKGVGYVVVSTDYYKPIGRDERTGELRFVCSHAVVSLPHDAGIESAEQMQETFLFRLLYGQGELSLFRLLRAEKDEATGTTYFLYSVIP